ncbi:TadE/TadG family type IV pilus assembly protein [Streptomyces yatensis]|uniref:TadE/TadG family type IV pilus assembly protein n=1 Tax=Streptomyces yatensis TaxID=155177 RepID=UPI0031BB0759
MAGRRPTAARRGGATAWLGDGRLPAAARPGGRGSASVGLRGAAEAARPRGRPAAGSGRAGGRRPGASRRWRGDAGSASIEFLGFLPILILVALAAVQLGIAAYAAQQAGTAARAAARTASLDEPRTSPQAAGEAAISGWLADGTGISSGGCGGGQAQATATVEIPSVIPGFHFGSAEKSATMPCDDGDGGTDSPGAAAMGGDR